MQAIPNTKSDRNNNAFTVPMLPIFALFNPALGMTTVVPEIDPRHPSRVDPAKIVQAIRQEAVTNSFGSPTLWRIVADYCDDAFFMTPAEVERGKAGIRHAFTKLLSDIPQAKWNLKTQLFENDILLLEWTADSAKTKIDDGIDTFVFKDGFIRAHTVRYTLLRK